MRQVRVGGAQWAGTSGDVLRNRYTLPMRTISQRELRNDSGEIMRGLERGESYRVTRRGRPVGVLRPDSADALDDLTVRHGTGVMEFPPGRVATESTQDVLRELRGDR